jgi:putative membrane protein
VSGARALDASSKAFIEDAIRGDNSEIALGQLAAKKGQGKEVRQFGQLLVTDHEKNKKEAANLLGGGTSEEMTPEAEQEIKKLQTLSGAEFDKEFATHMINDHRQDLEKFQQVANSGSGDVVDFARKSIPTLQKHLATAEGIMTLGD